MSETDKVNNTTPDSAPQAVPTPTPPPPPTQPQPNQAPPTYTVPPQQNTQAPPPPPHQQQQYKNRTAGFGSAKKEKWPAAALAFFLGYLGIHKFYLGYKSEGLAMLLITLIGGLCFGIGLIVMLVFSYIEAVKYVTLTEEDFNAVYVRGYKGWF